MKALALGAILLLVGCIGPEPNDPPKATLDVITPGVWHVSGADMIMAYYHNPTDHPVDVTWSLTFANGTALPAAWGLRFEPAVVTAEPAGTKVQTARGYDYPDWATTFIHVQDVPTGDYDLVLHARDSSVPVTMHATEARTTTVAGDVATVHYKGSFTETGEQFQQGEFDTTLSNTPFLDTVKGFDGGLHGLHLGETATLVLPIALAYGYDAEGTDRAQFDEKGLTFEVTIKAISS